MDAQDFRTLKLLELIETDSVSSQRELAKELEVSLGLVNSFIKRLVNKGYFKITTIPKNRLKYILTPKGLAEKTRLTYEYIHFSFDFYKKARRNFADLFRQLEQQGFRTVAFYGANDFAEIAYITLQETSLKLAAVADNAKKDQIFLGHRIIDSHQLASEIFDRLIVNEADPDNKIRKELIYRGILREKIVHVLNCRPSN